MASWTASIEPQRRPWWTRLRALIASSGLARI
jgi:hypothetical protein